MGRDLVGMTERSTRLAAANPHRAVMVAIAAVLAATLLVLVSDEADSARIIDNGVIQLGVHDHGELNVWGGSRSSGTGTTAVGLRYMPTNADATSPGCLCEGWGVAYDYSRSGRANQAMWPAVSGLTLIGFTSTPSTAVSTVRMGDLQVTHDYHPTSLTPNAYEADVVIRNVGSVSRDNVLYRRAMDWDIEPTAFDEYVTINGIIPTSPLPPSIVDWGNNGFRSTDPLVTTGASSGCPVTVFFTNCGPRDHGAQFTFNFGRLNPGDVYAFKIYYGAAKSETAAVSIISTIGAELWSIGKCNPTSWWGGASCLGMSGEPNVFFFGFTGVGGAPIPDFDWLPKPFCHNIRASFFDLSRPLIPSYPLSHIEWDFGDGTTAGPMVPGMTVRHKFPGPGTYPVTITVTDSKGISASLTKNVVVCNRGPDLPDSQEHYVLGGHTFVRRVLAPDPEDDRLIFTAIGNPTGSTMNESGIFIWPTRATDVGDYTFTINVVEADWGLGDTGTMIIHVLPSIDPPRSPLDSDGDGLTDDTDNCPHTFNPDQADSDADGIGNVCETEVAGGGLDDPGRKIRAPRALKDPEEAELAPIEDDGSRGGDSARMGDADRDGIPDVADNCVFVRNPGQADLDGDGAGDVCDDDIDGDGIPQLHPDGTAADNCPMLANPMQEDFNGNGIGDVCEEDPDFDGIPTLWNGEPFDNCPFAFNPFQDDADGDGLGDACDPDAPGHLLDPALPPGARLSGGSSAAAALPAGAVLWGTLGATLAISAAAVTFIFVRRPRT
jgi:PKD repeat protein